MLHKDFSSNPWIKPEYKLKRNTTARNGETSTEISRKFRHKLWLSVWFSPQQSCLPRTSLRRVLTLTASSTLRSSSTLRRWTPAASMTTRPSTRISAKPRNILVRAGCKCETQRGLSSAHLIFFTMGWICCSSDRFKNRKLSHQGFFLDPNFMVLCLHSFTDPLQKLITRVSERRQRSRSRPNCPRALRGLRPRRRKTSRRPPSASWCARGRTHPRGRGCGSKYRRQLVRAALESQ